MISRSPSRNKPASSRASSTDPLPFCRPTTRPTSKAAHFPSFRSARAFSSTNACHGSSTNPANAASSTASTPLRLPPSGSQQILGCCSPLITLRRYLVDPIPAPFRRNQPPQLPQNVLESLRAHRLRRRAVVPVDLLRQRHRHRRQTRPLDVFPHRLQVRPDRRLNKPRLTSHETSTQAPKY